MRFKSHGRRLLGYLVLAAGGVLTGVVAAAPACDVQIARLKELLTQGHFIMTHGCDGGDWPLTFTLRHADDGYTHYLHGTSSGGYTEDIDNGTANPLYRLSFTYKGQQLTKFSKARLNGGPTPIPVQTLNVSASGDAQALAKVAEDAKPTEDLLNYIYNNSSCSKCQSQVFNNILDWNPVVATENTVKEDVGR